MTINKKGALYKNPLHKLSGQIKREEINSTIVEYIITMTCDNSKVFLKILFQL